MPNKTVKFTLQAEPNGDQDVDVVITVDNVAVFGQTVPAVGPIELGVPDPHETFSFDLDVAASANVGATETRSFAISVGNGTVKIENILCNFTATFAQVGNVYNFIPGSANSFSICNIVSQPTWNGQAVPTRYNIEYNTGPIQVTGPGEVLILDSETSAFDVAVPAYNDSAPPPRSTVIDSAPPA
jgi:hypothetical protein